ncbi:MAG: heparinase II/III family protein [Pseudomonadota bacterium]
MTVGNAMQARLAGFARRAKGFVSQPEPRTIGRVASGKQLLSGNFIMAGSLVEAGGQSLFALRMPTASFEAEAHGFAWLDDLAAVGTTEARVLGQDWTVDWIARYGRGSGPGWEPDITGRRVIRWINHAIDLLNGQTSRGSRRFFRTLSRQVVFLSRRWQTTSPGLPRFEALAGLTYAGLALMGMERHMRAAVAALGRECDSQIDAEGGLPTRNPEELMQVFQLLVWAATALKDREIEPAPGHLSAIERAATTLRALRHADGALARFHGGGRGLQGMLDVALADSGIKSKPVEGRAMGFSRMSAGRTTILVDTAPPPEGKAAAEAHASTCAFELTSGRRPLIVSCGSGVNFGLDWRRAGRATPSHSVLCLEGLSSARVVTAGPRRTPAAEFLTEGPSEVQYARQRVYDGERLQVSHDAWRLSHGLSYARTLDLTMDGRAVVGEDLLMTLNQADKDTFARALALKPLGSFSFDVRFHLHPDAVASLDLNGTAVSITLKSGEVWVLRQDGAESMSVEPSVYLERGRLKPRASEQIVLRKKTEEQAVRLRWSLAKAQETPLSVRDLDRGEDAALG